MRLPGIEAARRRRGEERTETILLAHSGAHLSEDEAKMLEDRLAKSPNDTISRTRLLGYYFLAQFESEDERDRRAAHVLWFLMHEPESPILFTPYVVLDTDPDAYEAGKTLWLEVVSDRRESRELLENAAWFLSRRDPNLAEDLWERARRGSSAT